MKTLALMLVAILIARTSHASHLSLVEGTYLLLGPYEYDEQRRHVPRYYLLEGKPYTSSAALKAAIAALPPDSTVYLEGSCEPHYVIELPPDPMTLSWLQSYCTRHHVKFRWTFGNAHY
jgi:hypothetical protein